MLIFVIHSLTQHSFLEILCAFTPQLHTVSGSCFFAFRLLSVNLETERRPGFQSTVGAGHAPSSSVPVVGSQDAGSFSCLTPG